MARKEVPVVKSLLNKGVAAVGEALDKTDNHVVDLAGYGDDQIGIFIYNSSAVAGSAVIKAGDFSGAVQGDLTVTIPASSHLYFQVESARFKTKDGEMLIDIASAGEIAGTIFAFGGVY